MRKLLDSNYRVTVLDNLSTGLAENLPKSDKLKLLEGDVRDFDLVSKVIRNNPYVVHLAAQAFIPFSYQMPLQVAEINAIGSINILKACRDHKVKRLVHISSSEVYGSARARNLFLNRRVHLWPRQEVCSLLNNGLFNMVTDIPKKPAKTYFLFY